MAEPQRILVSRRAISTASIDSIAISNASTVFPLDGRSGGVGSGSLRGAWGGCRGMAASAMRGRLQLPARRRIKVECDKTCSKEGGV